MSVNIFMYIFVYGCLNVCMSISIYLGVNVLCVYGCMCLCIYIFIICVIMHGYVCKLIRKYMCVYLCVCVCQYIIIF